jgi:AbrB family looped-hinge helix DNA binding protein
MAHFTRVAGERKPAYSPLYMPRNSSETQAAPCLPTVPNLSPQQFSGCHFSAMIDAMKTTIDIAGRIVVPKALREALQLRAGQPLEARVSDGRLEIEPAPAPIRLVKRGKGVVAIPDTTLPKLTADEVRDTMERLRR